MTDKAPAVAVTAPHVFVAMSNVMEEIGRIGISKDRKNAQQGYSFRGIDDIYNQLNGLVAKNRLLMLPVKMVAERSERATKGGGLVNYTTLTVDFKMASAIDGSTEIIQTIGEAMDSADKSSNKAQSAAMKYASLMVFMIPTEGDNDADATTHEVEPQKPLWVVAAKTAITCLNTEAECAAWYKANVAMLKEADQAGRDEVMAWLKHRKLAVAPIPETHSDTPRTNGHAAAAPADFASQTPSDDEIPF